VTDTCFFIYSCFLRGIQAHVFAVCPQKATAKIYNCVQSYKDR